MKWIAVIGAIFCLSPLRTFADDRRNPLPHERRSHAEAVTLVILADFERDLVQNKGLSPERARETAQRLEARLARIFYQAADQTRAAQSYRWRILTRPSLSQLGALMEAPGQKALIFLGHSAGGPENGKINLPMWVGPRGENLTPFLSRLHPSIEHVSFVSCANQALLEHLKNDPDTQEVWNRPWLSTQGFEPKVPPVDGLVEALKILSLRLTALPRSAPEVEPQLGVPIELSYPYLNDEVWITFGSQLVAVLAPGQRGIKRFFIPLARIEAAAIQRRLLTLSVRFKDAEDSLKPLELRWAPSDHGAYQLQKLSAAQGQWLQIWTLFEGGRPWIGGSSQAWSQLEPTLRSQTQLYREYRQSNANHQ